MSQTTHDQYAERYTEPYREPSPLKTTTTHDAPGSALCCPVEGRLETTT